MDYIIMSWPPYGDDVAYNVLQALRTVNPKAHIIYIGEYEGCCADENFFNAIKNIPDNRFKEINQHFQQFCTSLGSFFTEIIHDRVYLFK